MFKGFSLVITSLKKKKIQDSSVRLLFHETSVFNYFSKSLHVASLKFGFLTFSTDSVSVNLYKTPWYLYHI